MGQAVERGRRPLRVLMPREMLVTCDELPSQVMPAQLHSVPLAPFQPV